MDKKEIEQICALKFRVRQMVGNIRRCYSGCCDVCEGCEYHCRPDCTRAQALEAAALLEELDAALAAMPNPKKKDMLIVRSKLFMPDKERELIRRRIKQEMQEGVVVLTPGTEVLLVPEDVEVRFSEQGLC